MELKQYMPTFGEIEHFNPEYQFTVFTPAYNAASTIHRVFNSLNKQTFKDFEVIIINDGSTDNTHEVIEKLLLTSNFKTTYINNHVNKHKMGCMLEAVQIARGAFFLTLDADDECIPTALEIFNKE